MIELAQLVAVQRPALATVRLAARRGTGCEQGNQEQQGRVSAQGSH
jgi:hypothetical protein